MNSFIRCFIRLGICLGSYISVTFCHSLQTFRSSAPRNCIQNSRSKCQYFACCTCKGNCFCCFEKNAIVPKTNNNNRQTHEFYANVTTAENAIPTFFWARSLIRFWSFLLRFWFWCWWSWCVWFFFWANFFHSGFQSQSLLLVEMFQTWICILCATNSVTLWTKNKPAVLWYFPAKSTRWDMYNFQE